MDLMGSIARRSEIFDHAVVLIADNQFIKSVPLLTAYWSLRLAQRYGTGRVAVH
jgi:hypothetical protein